MSEQALVASTGLLAGLGVTISLVCVPSINASDDPLPVWQITYKNGKKIALANILTSSALGVKCYYDSGFEKECLFLVVAGLASSIGVYTVLFMNGTNDSLFAVDLQKRQDQDGKVRKLIGKWSKLQLGRTLLGLGAFATAIYATYK